MLQISLLLALLNMAQLGEFYHGLLIEICGNFCRSSSFTAGEVLFMTLFSGSWAGSSDLLTVILVGLIIALLLHTEDIAQRYHVIFKYLQWVVGL